MNLTEFLNKEFFRGVSNGQFLGMVFGLVAVVVIMLLMGSTIIGWFLAALVGYMIPHLFHATHKEKAVYGVVACVCILLAGGLDLNPASIDAMKTVADGEDFKDIELTYDESTGRLVVTASAEAAVTRTYDGGSDTITFVWAGAPDSKYSELKANVESFLGKDVEGAQYSTFTVSHSGCDVTAVCAQTSSATYLRFAAANGNTIADASSSGYVKIQSTGTQGADDALALVDSVCSAISLVSSDVKFVSGAFFAAAAFSGSSDWSVAGEPSEGVAKLAYTSEGASTQVKVFSLADAESKYASLSETVTALPADGYTQVSASYGDSKISAALSTSGNGLRFAIQTGNIVVDGTSCGDVPFSGDSAAASSFLAAIAAAVFGAHPESQDRVTAAFLAAAGIADINASMWSLTKISDADTVPVLRYGGTINMIVFGGIYGPDMSAMDVVDFEGVATFDGWDTGTLHYFRLALATDTADGTHYYKDDDSSTFRGFTDACVYSGDSAGIVWGGAAYGMAFFAAIFFFITLCAWFFRRTMKNARKKMEDQGRLYPQGYGRCTKCGAIILPGEVECRKCGTYIERPDEMKTKKVDYFRCTNCGSEVPANAEVCPKCGATFTEEETEIVHSDGTMESAIECPDCGTIVPEGHGGVCICPKCGKRFQTGKTD